MTAELYTVMSEPPAVIVARLLEVCFPDARTCLDATYGSGKFWGKDVQVEVTGVDLDPGRGRDGQADFRALPYPDAIYDVVTFDPPFLSDCGSGSVMAARFGSYATLEALREAVEQGIAECWRVSRLGLIYKAQDYIHASRKVWMTRWPEQLLGEPYDQVHGVRRKLVDGKWKAWLSARSNCATYTVWRKDGQVHKRRRSA